MTTPDHGRNIITRGLPKTGQITQYRAGDDGQYEAGWWKGRLNANNRQRWIAKTIAGDDIVVDRATGLMWAADGNLLGCYFGLAINWNGAIDFCEGMGPFAGFSDWRLPNVKELNSIIEYDAALNAAFLSLIQEPPFANTKHNFYWVSTTDADDITQAYIQNFHDGLIDVDAKDQGHYIRAVRKGL